MHKRPSSPASTASGISSSSLAHQCYICGTVALQCCAQCKKIICERHAEDTEAKHTNGMNFNFDLCVACKYSKTLSSSGASSANSDPAPKPAVPPHRDGSPAKGVGKTATGAASPHRHEAPTAVGAHNYRTCSKCGTQDHWRRMKSELIEMPPIKGEDTMAEKEEVLEREKKGIYNKYLMTCVNCFATEKGVELAAAERLIKAPRTESRIARADKYNYAKENIQQFFDLTEEVVDKDGNLNKRGRTAVRVALAEMKDFFQPVLKILALKAMDEEAALAAAKKIRLGSRRTLEHQTLRKESK